MAAQTSTSSSRQTTADSRAARKRVLSIVALLFVQAVVLFVGAGRLDWSAAWVYLGVYVGVLTLNAVLLMRHHPDLVAERAKVGENTKSWDRILVLFVGLIMPMTALLVAGLDIRNTWTAGLSSSVQIVGLIVTIVGFAITSWSMVSNPFFSGVVRIQEGRGHTVATSGPYRFVRHPGYVGMILFNVGIPLLLGSLVALIPAGINVLLFVLRTALEDRTLQQELSGYSDYSRHVRYRLLPGVW